MADLTTAPGTSSCCSPAAQETCCEPSEKNACCGAGAAGGSCGCSAEAGVEIRETHRVRDHASPASVRAPRPA